jgi:hypothetical protein
MANNQTTQPQASSPSPAPTAREIPLESRFQNYRNLRDKIEQETFICSTKIADRFLTEAGKQDFLVEASQVIGERAIRHLPSKTNLTREDVSLAVKEAAEELAQKETWFDIMLPRKKRDQLVNEVSNSIDVSDQQAIQLAVREQQAYLDHLSENIPDEKSATEETSINLQAAVKIDKPTSNAIAHEVHTKVVAKSLHLGAETDRSTEVIVRSVVNQRLPDLSEAERQVAEQAILRKGSQLLQRKKAAAGLSSELINSSDNLVNLSDYLKKQMEIKPEFAIANGTDVAKGTTLFLKQPVTIGGQYVYKIELHNETSNTDPSRPKHAVIPVFDETTPQTARNFDTVRSFQFYDPKSKNYVAIKKDQIDERVYRKIDQKSAQRYINIFNKDKQNQFVAATKWIKNPTREAAKLILKPITTRVGNFVNKVTAPVRKMAAAVGKTVGKAVNVVAAPVRKAYAAVKTVVGKAVNLVTTPIKNAAGKVIAKGLSLFAGLLIKAGLGGLVKTVEQAALAGSGIGIPLLLLQETVGKGIGNLIGTTFKFGKDVKKTFQSFQGNNIGEGLKNVALITADTTGAAIGAIGGAVIGTVGGATIGALIGSVIPVIGTIIGGIIGGLGGFVFGVGTGTKAGYEFRRTAEKKLKQFLMMRYLLQFLNPLNIIKLLIGSTLGIVAGFIKGFLAKAFSYTATFVQQSGFGGLLKGFGNFFDSITSNIAKGFNTVTGKLAQIIQSSTGLGDAVGTALTQQPSLALTLTPPAAIISGIVISGMVYTVLISVFYVHPTDVDPYRPGPPGNGHVVKCNNEGEAGEDITAAFASTIQNASVDFLLLPNTVMTHGYCITPTMIILHSSAGYDNNDGAQAVLRYHNQRGTNGDWEDDVGCHFATDTDDTILMLHFYENQVQMAYCAGTFGNEHGIHIEMAGEISPGNINMNYVECDPPVQPGPPNLSNPDDNLYFVGDPPDAANPSRSGHPCYNESELGFDAICKAMVQYQIPVSQVFQHKEMPAEDFPHSDVVSNDRGGTRGDWVEDWFVPRLQTDCPGLPAEP